MNYFSSDSYYTDFYQEACLCGYHGNMESNEAIDGFGAFQEMENEYFSFSSMDASDFNKSGELYAA